MIEYQLREEHFLIIETTSCGIKVGSVDNNVLASYRKNFVLESPFVNGHIEDWNLLEKIWHVSIIENGIKKARNHSPVLLSIPSSITRKEKETIYQIFFEKFNVPGLYIADYSLMALYGYGQHLTGLILDLGSDCATITPVIDAIPQYQALTTIKVGLKHVLAHVKKNLSAENPKISLELNDIFAMKVLTECCEVSHVSLESDSHRQKKELAKVEFEFEGSKHIISDTKWKSFELLFAPISAGILERSLPAAVYEALVKCDSEKRSNLCANVVLTGYFPQMPGIKERLSKEMKKFLVLSDFANDTQPKEIRFPSMPEYVEAYKGRHEEAPFLGACLAAKMIFPDMKNYHSKLDYNEHGPEVVGVSSY